MLKLIVYGPLTLFFMILGILSTDNQILVKYLLSGLWPIIVLVGLVFIGTLVHKALIATRSVKLDY